MGNATPRTREIQQWLVRMREGDQQASNELMRGVLQQLKRLARKMLHGFPQVRRWEDEEDVVQRASLRLLRALHRFHPDSTKAFYALAAKVMRRVLIDLARHYYGPEGAGANQESITLNGEAATAPFDPEDRRADLRELERWYRFHMAVEQLPTKHREVVSLIFYHNWKQKQVAELFGIEERTVRRYWQEALLALREALHGELPSA